MNQQKFKKNGFVVLKKLFSKEEVELLYNVSVSDSVTQNAFEVRDNPGKLTKLMLWFTPGDDTFGLMSRSKRIVPNVQDLLGEGEMNFELKEDAKAFEAIPGFKAIPFDKIGVQKVKN